MMRRTIASWVSVAFGVFVTALVAGCPQEEEPAAPSESSTKRAGDESGSTRERGTASAPDAGQKDASTGSERGAEANPHGMPAANPHAAMNPHAGPGGANSQGQAASGSADSSERDGVLTVTGISLDVPDGWQKQKPTSPMRLAQYSIPGEAGAADLLIHNFGPGQGGGVGLNIERWVNQFKNPDDPSAKAKSEVSRGMRGKLSVTTVVIEGTYSPGAMPGMPPQEPQDDSAMYGMIIEGGPAGTVFVKVTGPKATIDAAKESLEAFNQSARLAE